jgi:hypothetical protein
MESSARRSSQVLIWAFALLLGGCQAAAPIRVWAPPAIKSAVGKRVAIAPLAGDPKIAGPLHAAMLRERPREPGRQVFAIDAGVLEKQQQIRLASATVGETSDIALLNLARRNGIDFVLQGEVLPQRDALKRPARPGPDPLLPPRLVAADWIDGTEPEEDEESLLRVSWNLIDVSGNRPLNGQPIVTRRSLEQPSAAVITVAAQSAWELVVPHVVSDQAQLSAPRFAVGASAIRQGNEAAAQGNWHRAQQIWEVELQRRPRQHAAMHNLALAAVARQDYPEARRLIAQALRANSSSLYQSTAVWIEQRQRDYHIAFGLPDPPEGWAATSR